VSVDEGMAMFALAAWPEQKALGHYTSRQPCLGVRFRVRVLRQRAAAQVYGVTAL